MKTCPFTWLPPATLAAIAAVLLGGCAVGPDFTPPAPPRSSRYTSEPIASRVAPRGNEPAQDFVAAQPVAADWWQLFRSPALDRVVRETIAANPSLDAARATLAQAQQTLAAVRGGYYPQVDFAASATRQKGPAFALGLLSAAHQKLPVYTLYSLGPSVGFSPDVFGLVARRVEQQTAVTALQAYQLAAAQLALTGNAVTEALTIASLREQIATLERIVDDDEALLARTRERFAAGKTPQDDVLAARTELASDRALLPPLEQQLAVAEHALAVLVGKSPAEWSAPAFDLADFTLPAELPVSVPSALVRQRPDILAAQAKLHASSAAIGVATAQMYPSFALSASIDTAALSTTSLFNQASLVWTLSAGLTAPIFHGGTLNAERKAAIEGFHASLATYRQTVLAAFGQVADTLRALQHDAALVDAQRDAIDAADASLALQQARHAVGRTDLMRLLDAERSARRARLGYDRARAQRYLDSTQLFVAMGGGWWKDPNLATLAPPLDDDAGGGAAAAHVEPQRENK